MLSSGVSELPTHSVGRARLLSAFPVNPAVSHGAIPFSGGTAQRSRNSGAVSNELPVESVLPELVERVRKEPVVLLEAPPGSGKTTRVPEALLPLFPDSRIIVLEPRRIAARWAARFVSLRRGEALGRTVGYQVRFDDRTGPETRIVYATEGILTRRFLDDPDLAGVGCVVLDEFHERHLPGDLALALTRRLQGKRPDLRLVVMSATLGAEALAGRLGHPPVLRAEGRQYPVEVRYQPRYDPRPLEEQVAEAVCGALRESRGHVLVFLPGAADIRRAAQAIREPVRVVPLHGDLPPEEQDEAIRPSTVQKVILSTNVAESSLTVPGVETVIDSGLARILRQAAWSGLPTLLVERVSRSSADQRAGRAGRTGPGRCVRLFTHADYLARPEHEAPEIQRVELAELLLDLHALGARDLPWLDAPPPEALERAATLLELLGATRDGGLTDTGRRMSALPAAPRAARILVECHARGRTREGCEIAAALSERRAAPPSRRRHAHSDLLDRPLSPQARRAAQQLMERARRLPAATAVQPGEEPLLQAILAGFPDRVARARKGDELLLALGGTARLAPTSDAHGAEWLVALDAEDDPRKGRLVRSASPVDPAWLLDHPALLEERTELLFTGQRVEQHESLRYGELVLHESRRQAPPGPEAGELLLKAAATLNPDDLGADRLAQLHARIAVLARALPEEGWEPPDDFPTLLRRLCGTCTSLKELKASGPAFMEGHVRERLGAQKAARLDTLAPTHLGLPGRKRAPVEYPPDGSPYVASRMADFFGLRDAPRIAGGRLPLVVHLLAPSNRPVQITSDLAGFWERHWPRVRKELMRRYPRHPWPENPT